MRKSRLLGGLGPKKSTDGKLSFVRQIAMDGQSIFLEEAIKLPLGHVLVIFLSISRIVQRHLKESNTTLFHNSFFSQNYAFVYSMLLGT